MMIDIPKDISENITQEIVILLNELLKKDPKATTELFRYGAPCDSSLEKHSEIIVREVSGEGDKTSYQISVLGILNSILLKIGQRRVAMVEEDGASQVLAFKPFRSAL
jgi:hypothetical protein